MLIEYYGPFNEDGSSMPLSVYEIDADCARVLVAPHAPSSMGPVWGFKNDGQQVTARLVSHDPRCVITG